MGRLVLLSVASGRFVEIIKGIISFLNLQNEDEKKESMKKEKVKELQKKS